MAVALEGADEIGAGEFLDADAGALQIEGEHPVFAVSVSKLADVLGWKRDVRLEVLEGDFLGQCAGELEAAPGGEGGLESDRVGVVVGEISGKFDLPSVGLGPEIFRARGDLDAGFQKVCRQFFRGGLVEVDDHPAGLIGGDSRFDVGDFEGLDFADFIAAVFGEAGGGG